MWTAMKGLFGARLLTLGSATRDAGEMRVSTILRSLASGLAVYVIAAACGSAERNGSSTGPSSSTGGLLDAIADGVTNPVGEAQAAEPELSVEQCTKDGDDGFVYAEHDYPGKTMLELTSVRVLVRFAEGSKHSVGLRSYDHGTVLPMVRDGSVLCGSSTARTIADVTFILPR